MQNDRRWLIINEPLTIPGMHIQVIGNAFHAFHVFLTCGESQGMRSRKSSQASKIPLWTRNGCSRIFPKCSFVAGESHPPSIIHQGAFGEIRSKNAFRCPAPNFHQKTCHSKYVFGDGWCPISIFGWKQLDPNMGHPSGKHTRKLWKITIFNG